MMIVEEATAINNKSFESKLSYLERKKNSIIESETD